MTDIPDLRVVPLDRIRPHEEVDPLRVEPLAGRIGSEGIQLNPVVCVEADDNELVLLDGATRTAALRSLGLGYGVAQVVKPEAVELGTWHHVLRSVDPDDVMTPIRESPYLTVGASQTPPRLWSPSGPAVSITGQGVSPNRSLSSLVATYLGRWKSNRVINADVEYVAWHYPDWGALVEFPELSLPDVTAAALSEDLLPAGITRFVVPDRALRLSYSLEELKPGGSTEEKQERLEKMIEDRAREGRIRRYAEPVVILDD